MTVRVLIVDDSATMRSLIAATLRQDPEIEIVGQAGDPLQAREAIKQLNPDVITLDIEMPNMNGIEFLEKIMRLRPMPVIMVSTLTKQGAEATIEALELGAFDCVAKPSTGGMHAFDKLADKVKVAARAKVRPRSTSPAPAPSAASYRSDGRLLAIGSSTGGVEALITVLSQFPANCPPTLITQHMPATFTKSFAERLNKMCAPEIAEASEGAPIVAGKIYIAPGGPAHLEVAGSGALRCRLREGDTVNGHRPSVDVLFQSVVKTMGKRAIGVILTGMGRDGAAGLKAMREAGGATLGQDEQSCVVYGMPKVAFELGGVERQVSLQRMAAAILSVSNADNREKV